MLSNQTCIPSSNLGNNCGNFEVGKVSPTEITKAFFSHRGPIFNTDCSRAAVGRSLCQSKKHLYAVQAKISWYPTPHPSLEVRLTNIDRMSTICTYTENVVPEVFVPK